METGGIELVSHLLPLATTSHPEIIGDMLEFRRIFGREVARLAAERAKPEHLQQLRDLAAKVSNEISPQELFDLDFDFYVSLAAGTCNRVIGLLVNTVRDALKSYTIVLVHVTAPAEDVRQHHRDMLAALEANEADRAAEIAETYLATNAQRVLDMMAQGLLPEPTSSGDDDDDGEAADGGGEAAAEGS